MREIKFRCWDTIDKKWLFGYDYENLGGFSLIGETVLFGQLNTVSLERWNDVAIMQFTGLKSKTDQEIYEGDICTKMISPDENNRAPKELYRGEIVYHYGSFCLKVDGYYYPLSRQHGVIEVIGNIYQNPELL